MIATTISAITWPAAYLPETRDEPDMRHTFMGREESLPPSYDFCPIYDAVAKGRLKPFSE